jgi:hypothetical protein
MQVFTLLISILFLLMPFSFRAEGNMERSNHSTWAEHEPLSFMLSPNPVHRDCVLEVNQPVDLLILDIRGKEVFRLNDFRGGDLELAQLEEGIYFLQLITPTLVRTQRLIKVSDKN